MRHAVWAAALLLTFCTARAAAAAVYRWVDDDGSVHYADRAPQVPMTSEPSPPPSTVGDIGPVAREAPSPPEVSAPADVPTPGAARTPTSRAASPRPPRIVDLMERMHLVHDVHQLARQAQLAVRGHAFRSRHAANAWPAVSTAFSTEALIATSGDRLTLTLADSPLLPQMLGWLRSPIGSRVMDLGAQPDSPARQAAFRRFAGELPDAVSLDRVRLAREFGQASDFVSLSIDAGARIEGAIADLVEARARGVRARGNRGGGWTTEGLRWRARMSLLFAFRDLSDDDLRDAIAFWNSLAGRALTHAYRDAVLTAITTAHERAAEALRPRRAAH